MQLKSSGHSNMKKNAISNIVFNAKSKPNNHNAGELLILVFIEVGFSYNVSGDCCYIRQPVIA